MSEAIIMLNNVRLAFPVLFEAKKVNADDKGKPAFSCSLILGRDHPDVAKLKAVIADVAKAKWGDTAAETLKTLNAGQKICLRDGDAKAHLEGYAGNMFVSARSTVRPLVVDRNKEPLTAEDGKPYSGCCVNAQIAVWAQANQHGKRINAQIRGVQFLRDGDAFSGGGRPADIGDFDTVDDSADVAAPDAGDEYSDLIG